MPKVATLLFAASLLLWGAPPAFANGCWGECLPGGECVYEDCDWWCDGCLTCHYTCPEGQVCTMVFCDGEPSETNCDGAPN